MIDTRLNRSTRWLGVLLLVLGLSLSTNVQAQPDKDAPRKGAKLQPTHPVLQVQAINNASLWLRRNGKFDWVDPFSGDNDAYPKGASSQITFAQGLMWGGQVKDGNPTKVRVNGSTYASGMAAGGINWNPNTGEVMGAQDATNRQLFHVWRVNRDWTDPSVIRQNAAYIEGKSNPQNASPSVMEEVRAQYKYDWENWGKIASRYGAPFEECNGVSGYQPADPDKVRRGVPCSELDGDIPGRPGASSTMWAVMNDIGSRAPSDVSQNSYGSPAIGMEIQYTIWAYDRPPGDPLGNINFIKARLIYTGLPGGPSDARIDSMFTSWWVDPDVGTFSNDFAGVDTTLSMGFAYNGSAVDGEFQQEGLPPGAGGWDFLKGPVVEGDTLGLTSFVFFAAGTDITDPNLGVYSGTLQWYNLMRGFKPRPEYPQGDPFINPNTGEVTEFTLAGDPVTGTGWVDGSTVPPADRRIVNTTGPFTMQKGDTVSVVIGQVRAIGTSQLSSISRLKFFDTAAQFAFDSDFQIPSPPPSPTLTAAQLDKKVVLNWGTNREKVNRIESHSPGDFNFEAYRVYQLPSRTASLEDGVRIATFDVKNQVRTLVNSVFEEESGFVVTKPVQALDNQGVRRFLHVTRDRIRSRPLANGVDYYFAVTALSYLAEDRNVPSRILESSPAVLQVRPQPPKPGVTNIPSVGDTIGVNKVSGPGELIVRSEVVDPSRVKDATYTMTVNYNPNTEKGSWNLLQNGSPVLTGQEFGILASRQTVGGLKFDMAEPLFKGKAKTFMETVAVNDPNSSLNLWGDATLFGLPVGYYSVFTGQSGPPAEDARQNLEFRFTGNGGMESPTTEGGQLGTYYALSAFGKTDLSGVPKKTIRMPFELWETEKNRQINVAVIGRNADGNAPWGTGAGDYYRMSGRDYIIPIHTQYNQSEVQSQGTSPAADAASWLLFFEQGGASTWDTGDVLKIRYPNKLNPQSDKWEVVSKGPRTGVESDLKASVDNIGVFPNPYRGFNRLENSRFDKFVRFRGLPPPSQAGGPTTIRIFTLSGNPVRVIKHTEDSPNAQYHDWDLENESGVPVASGIYLAHINTPVGEKILKVAIVMEEEILRRY